MLSVGVSLDIVDFSGTLVAKSRKRRNVGDRNCRKRFAVKRADYYGVKAATTLARAKVGGNSAAKGNGDEDDDDDGMDGEEEEERERGGEGGGESSHTESRGKETRGCTHSEVSAGLRIKTRGEFESGKVLNDFRRSCLASWFIRKSQFAQRAERTSEIDGGRKTETGRE